MPQTKLLIPALPCLLHFSKWQLHCTHYLGTRLSSPIELLHPTSHPSVKSACSTFCNSIPSYHPSHCPQDPSFHHPLLGLLLKSPPRWISSFHPCPFIDVSHPAAMVILYKIRSRVSSLLKSFHDFLFCSVEATP